MFQKNSILKMTFLGTIGLAVCSSGAASLTMIPCGASCFREYLCKLQECNDRFNNPEPPSDDYQDAMAWWMCREGARSFRSSCEDDPTGEHAAVREMFWNEFLANLRACIDLFGEGSDDPAANEDNLYDCIEEALAHYRQELENYFNDLEDACGENEVPASWGGGMFVGQMDALQLAAVELGNLDGKYPVVVNSSVGVTAGINVSAGSPYDVGQMPCIKSAISIAIYQTKTGVAVEPIDADIDTSDGTTFDILFFADKLVDAKEVMLLNVFFDENDTPRMGEVGIFTIQDSPISGDWNRDEVLNTQDVIDFLDSYNAQTKRADITDDGIVDPADAVEFTEDYTE